MLRTLGGRNIGKCRLRAHRHPLKPPLPNQPPHKLPPTYLQSDSSNERVLKMACCMHRFLISSPNLRIDASFSTFTPSCVHRFLILSSDLRIDARGEWFRLQQLLRQRCFASDSILRSRKEEWFRLQRLSRQRSSASDSILRRCKEEWPACSGSRDDDPPRPILIFVAAKKNGSACSSSTKTAKIEFEIGQVLQ